jgi:hypothetical protein
VALALGPPVQLGSGDLAQPALLGSAGAATGLATAAPATGGGVPEAARAVGPPGGVRVARAAPVATSFGRSAARSLRSGIGLVALAGLAAAAAVLRAARRQLSLIGSSGEDA